MHIAHAMHDAVTTWLRVRIIPLTPIPSPMAKQLWIPNVGLLHTAERGTPRPPIPMNTHHSVDVWHL